MFEKFAEQFEQDVTLRCQEKLAKLLQYMEKDAAPDLRKYLGAVSKRNRGVNRLNQIGENASIAKNTPATDFVQEGFNNFWGDRGQLAIELSTVPSLGASGNKAMNKYIGNDALTRIRKFNQDNYLRQKQMSPKTTRQMVSDNVTNGAALQNIAESSRPDSRYLSKLTGITDQNDLNTIMKRPGQAMDYEGLRGLPISENSRAALQRLL